MIHIKNLKNINFYPYNRNNETLKGIYWNNINYNENDGIGSYVLKFDPGAITKFHKHLGEENFFVLEGEITDSFTKETYSKGNYVSLEKNSCHYSYSEKGCILLVFSQGHIERFE